MMHVKKFFSFIWLLLFLGALLFAQDNDQLNDSEGKIADDLCSEIFYFDPFDGDYKNFSYDALLESMSNEINENRWPINTDLLHHIKELLKPHHEKQELQQAYEQVCEKFYEQQKNVRERYKLLVESASECKSDCAILFYYAHQLLYLRERIHLYWDAVLVMCIKTSIDYEKNREVGQTLHKQKLENNERINQGNQEAKEAFLNSIQNFASSAMLFEQSQLVRKKIDSSVKIALFAKNRFDGVFGKAELLWEKLFSLINGVKQEPQKKQELEPEVTREIETLNAYFKLMREAEDVMKFCAIETYTAVYLFSRENLLCRSVITYQNLDHPLLVEIARFSLTTLQSLIIDQFNRANDILCSLKDVFIKDELKEVDQEYAWMLKDDQGKIIFGKMIASSVDQINTFVKQDYNFFFRLIACIQENSKVHYELVIKELKKNLKNFSDIFVSFSAFQQEVVSEVLYFLYPLQTGKNISFDKDNNFIVPRKTIFQGYNSNCAYHALYAAGCLDQRLLLDQGAFNKFFVENNSLVGKEDEKNCLLQSNFRFELNKATEVKEYGLNGFYINLLVNSNLKKELITQFPSLDSCDTKLDIFINKLQSLPLSMSVLACEAGQLLLDEQKGEKLLKSIINSPWFNTINVRFLDILCDGKLPQDLKRSILYLRGYRIPQTIILSNYCHAICLKLFYEGNKLVMHTFDSAVGEALLQDSFKRDCEFLYQIYATLPIE